MPIPKSAARFIKWPAIPTSKDAALLAMQYQLEQSQWWPPEEIERLQFEQLSQLLAHAYKYVPFHQSRLKEIARQDFVLHSREDLGKIPIITRRELQDNFDQLVAKAMPEDHLPMRSGQTSGSTGRPVKYATTSITKFMASAFVLRNHLWHQQDLTVRAAKILLPSGDGDDGKDSGGVSQSWIAAFPSGTMASFDSGRTVSAQLKWLQQHDPQWLVTYPSNLAALARAARDNGITLTGLKYLSTLGEVVTPEVRALCREVWGATIVDIYSCKEVNTMALQCPQHEHYHVQSEHVIVEVLDAAGRPCQPGEVGRVVVTDLHNFGMPILRYELGDFAEVGEACPCGRTLPVLSRILGRTRNMLTLPSGDKMWPAFIISRWAALGPISQLQIVQHSATEIEVKAVLNGKMKPADESNLLATIRSDLSADFDIRLSYVDDIPRSASGKFEDFLSKIN